MPIPPNNRFEHLNIDIIGPYPESHGMKYCLTIIDRFSRWPAAIPMADATADSVARALLQGWIQNYGVPLQITTDRGRQFEADLFHKLGILLGTRIRHTTSFNPKCNGIIERWHRTVKTAIKCHATDDWAPILPIVVLALRCIVKEDLDASPAEMLYGETIRLPGAFFDDKDATSEHEFLNRLRHVMANLTVTATSHHDKVQPFVHQRLKDCSHVYVRDDTVKRPFQRPYLGPYKVLKRTDKYFTLMMRNKEDTVSLDRLKPAFCEPDPTVPAVPRTTPELNEPIVLKEPNVATIPPLVPAPPPTVMRSGRRDKIPLRYQ